MPSTPELIRELEGIVGPEHVIWRPEDLLVYEYDGSIEKGAARVVVVPGSTEEVAAVVKAANRRGVPVTPRGAGTGLSGGAVAREGSLVLAFTRLNRILEIDPVNRVAVVEPGVVNIKLSEAVAPHGLQFVPDPSSQKVCTIGGNVAENAGGPHCLAYGVTANHVLGIEVVLADGSIAWLGGQTRETPGYDLRGVFVGSEGTLAIATRIAVRLMPLPEAVHTTVATFRRMDDASQAVTDIIASGIVPGALEMMDHTAITAVEPVYHPGYSLDAEAVLLVEVDGLRETVEEQAPRIEEVCRANNATDIWNATEADQRQQLWAARKGAFGAFGSLAPNYTMADGVVPRTKLPEIMRTVQDIAAEIELTIANVFHAGDGNLHPCILFDEREPGALARVIEANGRILQACVAAGGALSGEHGIGIEKQEFLPLVFSEADMAAMARLKPAFGAGDSFNPSKLFSPAKQTPSHAARSED
ncbi:MAG: FAD-binding protein [Chloroflexi bacterium]|nr:FAD-binding protein [Chloroflexota bacterium]